jgi:hypothetical protein
MDISFGGIFGAFKAIFSLSKQRIEKYLFHRAYEISTIYYSHRQAFGRPSHHLSQNLSYNIHWEKYYLRERKNCPIILVKSENGKTFSKLVLSVTASNDKIKYQNTLTLFDINSIPTQAALPSIPFRNIRIKGNQVFTPYDHISTIVIELYDAEGQPVDLFRGGVNLLYPCDRLEIALGLEKGDIEKWGEVFNLQFIEREIIEERIRLIGGLSRFYFFKRRIILSNNWIVKANFWRKNLGSAKQLTGEFENYLLQEKELENWRQKKQMESQMA